MHLIGVKLKGHRFGSQEIVLFLLNQRLDRNDNIHHIVLGYLPIDLVNVTIPKDYDVTITFTLVYDENTFDTRYGDLMLFFDGIYIFSELVD